MEIAQQSRHAVISAQKTYWKNDASVGAPPREPVDFQLRCECDSDLQRFLEVCFPAAFPISFSPTHIRMITEIQRAIRDGGLKAIGAPRGSGKTTILIRAAMWAILTGRRRYVCLVAADEDSAVSILQVIKREILSNEKLCELYGYETWSIRQLANEPRRAANQHWQGKPTGVQYGRNDLTFGSIPDCLTNNAVITTAGITGRIRGQQSLTVEGDVIRPDFVLVDDPQTKLSASSPSQCRKRHETMMGDVLGLAGPGVKIAGFTTCTVIYQGDLADKLLNRQLSPDWNGDKVKMIDSWPTNMDLWDQYHSIRVEELRDESDHSRSRQFVVENFDRMHDGAKVYWEQRKGEQDVSALHHAMDLYYRDPGVFHAEFQNEPLGSQAEPAYDLDVEMICRRITGLPRGIVPEETERITAFVDTQRELLYYMVVAWTGTGRAYVVDYGSAPDQKRHHWTKATVAYSLQEIYGEDFETYLRSGLDWLSAAILRTEYTTEGKGTKYMVDKLAVDARWGESTAVVRQWARESPHRSRIHPSMGQYIGANTQPWQQIQRAKETRLKTKGVHAKFITPKGGGLRELLYDTNYWKSWCASRLSCSSGSSKAITLFHSEPHIHMMFAQHCCNEDPVRMIGKKGNEVVEWKQKQSGGSPENDFWDCLVGNAALASTIGVETHSGNKTSSTHISKAIERVLTKKPKNQFFRERR